MDLVAIMQTVRRHKFAALPVIILTAVLAVYVLLLSTPDYEAGGVYALVNPRPGPTPAQIAQDPALGNVNPNNPLVSYGNLSIVSSMLTQTVGTQSGKRLLLANGVDPRSTVTTDPSENVPVLTVTGIGSTAAEAVHSGRRLGQVLSDELNRIQTQLSVSRGYRITAYPLDLPNQASLKLSGKLRELLGVLALGMILLWVSVSVAVARAERRRARASSVGSPRSIALERLHRAATAQVGIDGAANGDGTGHPLVASPGLPHPALGYPNGYSVKDP